MSQKGLHLSESGSRYAAINFLERTEKFWKNERYTRIVEEDELAICGKKLNLSSNHVESDKKKDKCPNVSLKSLREENFNHPIFAQININSVRNKFQFLAPPIINTVDVLLVSETKLDILFRRLSFC